VTCGDCFFVPQSFKIAESFVDCFFHSLLVFSWIGLVANLIYTLLQNGILFYSDGSAPRLALLWSFLDYFQKILSIRDSELVFQV
jgi:hypothetical protein